MTITTINQELDTFGNTIVAKVCGREVTQKQMSLWFDQVADKQHWKNPIDCIAYFDCDYDLDGTRQAIEFFTGSKATFTALGRNQYRVKAAGYFRTIGA